MRKRSERHVIRFILLVLVIGAGFFIFQYMKNNKVDNTTPVVKNEVVATSSLPAWTTKTIKEKTKTTEIDIQYPEFKTIPSLNAFILKKINQVIKDDRDLLNTAPNTDIDLTASYEVIGMRDDVMSIELTIIDFTGGGNGNHDEPYTINWDLKKNKNLEPEDLFCSTDYMNVLAPIAREKLIAELDATGDSVDDIDKGLKPDTVNWQNFAFAENGLLVIFPPYQVTAGAAGIVKILIPYDAIPGLVCLR